MTEQTEKTGQATYCPEDNKLRLYVGRVPRDEYLKLRADGWTALHKQREAGQGDFAATWSPSRVATCLEYADCIEDEDAGPDERAADRAERFSGYRDKRSNDATGQADRFDGQPMAHGYQDQQRAERAAERHDRIADRAVDMWSKAEYWQRRTAGVISHALYKSSPGVRMGRIKELESLLRKHEKETEQRRRVWAAWCKVRDIADPEEQTKAATKLAGSVSDWSNYKHPRTGNESHDLYSFLSPYRPEDQITGAEACALFFSKHSEPREDNAWSIHYKMRLAYENQMLAAAGGRLEQFEVLPGGKLGGKLILKVNKSSATGRATSADIIGPKVDGWHYRASNLRGTEYAVHSFDLERLSPDAYTPPTPESLAELAKVKAAIKAAAPVKDACPLINPTDADAERLQALWNERALADYLKADPSYHKPEDFKPSTICRITQAVYSANSKGSFARAETRGLCSNGELENNPNWNMYSREREARAKRIGPALCKIRKTHGDGNTSNAADRVIILTDKPQKPLPAAVWQPLAQPQPETVNA